MNGPAGGLGRALRGRGTFSSAETLPVAIETREPFRRELPHGDKAHLCWVVISGIHYHAARLEALGRQGGIRASMIQLTDTDLFAALRPEGTASNYTCHTLFPAANWSALDSRALAECLERQLDELRPTVVCINGWSVGGCIAALRWCLRHRVPAILMSDSAEQDEPRRWWKEAIKRRIVGLCSAALVAGKPHREYLTALGMVGERIFDGYDVVDNHHFESGAAAAQRDDAKMRAEFNLPGRYFLACCRFEPKKNLARTLNAYAAYRLAAGAESWPLIVLGDGSQREALEMLRADLGLGDHVMLPGFKSYRELPVYYGLASVFLHLSTTDQWGLVVNEAMAAGLPVIVSRRCGCAGDLVKHGVNGFAVDPCDVAGISRAMHRMTASVHSLESMARASRRVISRWDTDRFVRNLLAAGAVARANPPRTPGIIDRALMGLMAQWRN
jgi:glycosyltransferase involved in cell wall biosynthesis